MIIMVFVPQCSQSILERFSRADERSTSLAEPLTILLEQNSTLTKLKLSDDELAAIIGHEISHALLEHGRERASRDLVANIIISKINGNGQAIAYYASQLGLALPFNRSQESEADLLGLKIAAKAGYNPKAAITLWQKFGQIDKNSNNKLLGMLSTHPLPEKRMNDLKAAVPQFMRVEFYSKRSWLKSIYCLH